MAKGERSLKKIITKEKLAEEEKNSEIKEKENSNLYSDITNKSKKNKEKELEEESDYSEECNDKIDELKELIKKSQNKNRKEKEKEKGHIP